jgi:hypothetical protein
VLDRLSSGPAGEVVRAYAHACLIQARLSEAGVEWGDPGALDALVISTGAATATGEEEPASAAEDVGLSEEDARALADSLAKVRAGISTKSRKDRTNSPKGDLASRLQR